MTNGHFESCATPYGCWCEIKRYIVLFGIGAMILIAEVVGGIISQSLALLADAGHVFTDSGAILVSIIVGYHVKCGADETRTRKIGGYINTLLLGVSSIWIWMEALERLKHPRAVVSWVMISIAVLGTLGNYLQHKMIESSGEDHVTQESMRLHILSDLVQSVGVVFGGVMIYVTNWVYIDPIISMIIALYMGKLTLELLRNLLSGKYDNKEHRCHGHDH